MTCRGTSERLFLIQPLLLADDDFSDVPDPEADFQPDRESPPARQLTYADTFL